jgi:hypothetical protein
MASKNPDTGSPNIRERAADILNEIRGAQDDGITPESIYERITPYFRQDPALEIPVIDALAKLSRPDTAALLSLMRSSSHDKTVIKSIKKTLFKLKQQGIESQTEDAGTGSILRRTTPAEPQGYLGPPDGVGNSVVVVARPRSLGGLRVFFSILHDADGIRHFESSDLRRKGLRAFIEELSTPQFPLIEAPGPYCIQIINQAAQIMDTRGTSLPPGYREAAAAWADVTWKGVVPLIYQYIPEAEVREHPHLLRESGNLHHVAPFSSWFLEKERLERHVQTVLAVQESHLVLSESQQQARRHDAYVTALHDLFPEDERLRWKRRLEDVAYVLRAVGRDHEARSALSAAVDLASPLKTLDPNPFIWNLLLKSMAAAMGPKATAEGSDPGNSLIITP